MRCPSCNQLDSQVKDSRTSNDYTIVRRRRYCPSCHAKFTTIERTQERKFHVTKRSGVKKFFEREKIVKCINLATRKRNISMDKIDQMISDIIIQIEGINSKEITTKEIGELIMNKLLEIDKIAYIRFASVYYEFSSPQDFGQFISKLFKKK